MAYHALTLRCVFVPAIFCPTTGKKRCHYDAPRFSTRYTISRTALGVLFHGNGSMEKR